MNNSLDPLFGFPRIIRFSWSTTSKFIETNGGYNVDWETDLLLEQAQNGGANITNYFKKTVPVEEAKNHTATVFEKQIGIEFVHK